MRAKTVNFERGQDPKKAMDIGLTPENLVANFVQALDDAGLDVEYDKTQGFDTAYDFRIWGYKMPAHYVFFIDDDEAWHRGWGKGGFGVTDDQRVPLLPDYVADYRIIIDMLKKKNKK